MYLVTPPYLLKKLYSKALWRVATVEKKIYLTFDDGPHPEVTPWVLDLLKKREAKATFFCVGANVEKHPEVFQRILAEEHCVGNHTFNHLNGWKSETESYISNVQKCRELVLSPFFRPPYGRMKRSQFSILNSQFSIIMWDVLSGDFDQSITKEKCLKNVMDNTRTGSIVVFHDSEKAKENLFYVLPKFLDHFANKGFVFKELPYQS